VFVAYAVDTAWTLITGVGVLVSTWALVDSILDRRARVKRGTDGYEKLMILMNLRSSHASLYLHGFFFLLGVQAFAHPTPFEATPTFIILAGGYIFVAAANVRAVGLNQLARWRTRRGKLPA
jgi:hypothetical protein